MKYPRVFQALRSEIWAIAPAAFTAIEQVVLHNGNTDVRIVDEGIPPRFFYALGENDVVRHADGSVVYERLDGVGVVSVQGVIGKRLSMMETLCGGFDIDDLREAVASCMEDSKVNDLLIDFNSPGGVVTGVPETADFIRSVSARSGGAKRIYGWTETTSASASMWLQSQCDVSVCTASSTVGSVGVYCARLDTSKAMETAGMRVDVIKSGKFKAAGMRGTPNDPEALALMQSNVDKLGAQFRAAMLSARPGIPAAAMEGQTFSGDQAVANGMCDLLYASMADLHRDIVRSRK